MEAENMGIITPKPTLPETGFVRLSNIIGDAKADPPIPAIIPVSRSTWLEGVKNGRYPRPVKLGPRIAAWRVSDIRDLISHGINGRNGSDAEEQKANVK